MNKLDEIRTARISEGTGRVLVPRENFNFLIRAVEQLSVEHKAIMKLMKKLSKDYSMIRADEEPMDIFEIVSFGETFEIINNALDPDIKAMVESD